MRDDWNSTRDWLAARWVVCAGFMAGALLTLAPLLLATLPLALVLLFLHGPVYMLHQMEEHTGDRFRRFINARLFGGLDALTVGAVLVINLPLVWGLNLGALYVGWLFGVGWGLAAPYCLVVNAVTHIGASARLRIYNPGLATAVVLFLPLGAASIWWIGGRPGVDIEAHAVGLGLALALHAGIVASVLRQYREVRVDSIST